MNPQHKICNTTVYMQQIFFKPPGADKTEREKTGWWCRKCKRPVESEELSFD